MKFIGYFPFGYPTIEESVRSIELYVEEGCKAFEISIPIYNAPGESPMIVDYMNKALDNCSNYDVYLDEISKFRKKHPDLEINLLVFFKTILEIGIDKFVQFYKDNNINALITPHAQEFAKEKEEMKSKGCSFFTSFHYSVDEKELEQCLKPNTVVYMTAFPPAWATDIKEGYSKPKQLVDYLRSHGVTAPIYAGVGISTPEKAREVRDAGADGFFVGGSIMSLIGQDEKLREAIRTYIAAGLWKKN